MSSGSTIFWMVLIIAFVWLIVLYLIFKNIANRKDLSLPGKAVWLLIIFLAPFIGLVAYLAMGKKTIKRK